VGQFRAAGQDGVDRPVYATASLNTAQTTLGHRGGDQRQTEIWLEQADRADR
jgi:hypothetical protein